MKRYPAYKDSDLEWIGEIPDRWSTKPLFALFKERQAPNEGNAETNVLSLSYGRIIRRDVESNFGLLPESFETYNIVEPLDIVLRLTDLQNDKRSLRCGLVQEKGIITSAYLTLEKKAEIDPKYMYYLLHNYDIWKVFYSMGGGVRQAIKFDDLKRLPILLPSFDEQKRIASYLDHKVSQMDVIIEKKSRIMDLLKEKRSAIVNVAVTKGIEQNVKLKNSGIEWVGEIPVSWEIKKLKYYFYFEKGKNAALYTNQYIGSNPGNYPVYSGQTENEGVMGRVNTFDYETNNVLLATTVGAKAMTLRMISGRYCLSQNCALLIPRKENLNVRYYKYFISSLFDYEKGMISLIMQPSLRFEDLIRYQILVPPLNEQDQIADFLDENISYIDKQIDLEANFIRCVNEYRTSLISEVVTGKIDVRDEVNV